MQTVASRYTTEDYSFIGNEIKTDKRCSIGASFVGASFVEVPDGPNRFDFTLKNHYHVRCIKCGEVSDVDMDEIPDLLERIHNTHGIDFWDYDISFKGICPKCREKVKEEQHG